MHLLINRDPVREVAALLAQAALAHHGVFCVATAVVYPLRAASSGPSDSVIGRREAPGSDSDSWAPQATCYRTDSDSWAPEATSYHTDSDSEILLSIYKPGPTSTHNTSMHTASLPLA